MLEGRGAVTDDSWHTDGEQTDLESRPWSGCSFGAGSGEERTKTRTKRGIVRLLEGDDDGFKEKAALPIICRGSRGRRIERRPDMTDARTGARAADRERPGCQEPEINQEARWNFGKDSGPTSGPAGRW